MTISDPSVLAFSSAEFFGTGVPTLVIGHSGVGKDTVARILAVDYGVKTCATSSVIINAIEYRLLDPITPVTANYSRQLSLPDRRALYTREHLKAVGDLLRLMHGETYLVFSSLKNKFSIVTGPRNYGEVETALSIGVIKQLIVVDRPGVEKDPTYEITDVHLAALARKYPSAFKVVLNTFDDKHKLAAHLLKRIKG